jgi:hypothetical protein
VAALLVLAWIVLVAVAGSFTLAGKVLTRKRLTNARLAARAALERGESQEAVAEWLVTGTKLPSLATVRAMADSTGLAPAEALEVVRPHLSARALDVIDTMPTAKFDKIMRNLAAS